MSLLRWWRRRRRDYETRVERDRLQDALDELVYLKDLKDQSGKTAEYEARQPLAWQAARRALGRKAYGQLRPIRAIEISFPVPVTMTVEHERMLTQLTGYICDEWCRAHFGRVMWPAGQGSKILYMPQTREDEKTRGMEFDDEVFAIDCCERERYSSEADLKP